MLNLSREIAAPSNEDELLRRCHAIAGRSLSQLASALDEPLPRNLKRNKGWVGQLVELALGSTAASRSVPDFEALGIELKTIPINARGLPSESTYVCTVSLTEIEDFTWKTSRVYGKMAHVLWLPIQADKAIPLGERRVGAPLLLDLPADLEAAVRQDWEEHAHLIRLGFVEEITAHKGKYLQIRPKAANASARRWGVGQSGGLIRTLPRGFYLRTSFTTELIQRNFI